MSSAAVAGGLTVGIAFVVFFSLFAFPPDFSGDLEDVTISLERTPALAFARTMW